MGEKRVCVWGCWFAITNNKSLNMPLLREVGFMFVEVLVTSVINLFFLWLCLKNTCARPKDWSEALWNLKHTLKPKIFGRKYYCISSWWSRKRLIKFSFPAIYGCPVWNKQKKHCCFIVFCFCAISYSVQVSACVERDTLLLHIYQNQTVSRLTKWNILVSKHLILLR